MVSISLRISDEFKAMIDKLPWVNWSELAREEAIEEEKRRTLLNRLNELLKNSEMTEELATKLGEDLKERLYKRIKSKVG